ncbi:MAG: sigma-70 family RNA polymerase sigma factor [Deltaproteobacteria bacterium]|nr:sigma-70 family RNA polymerase sigma factor [Deltaproteobacteria bacterium]
MSIDIAQSMVNDNSGTLSFGEFFDRHLPRARRLAWRLVGGDQAAADDVVQEAFCRAFHALPRFRGQAKLETWLHRIIVNESHNYRRKHRLMRESGETLERSGRVAPSDPALRRRIAEALEQLSESQRAAFVLVHLEQYTVKQSAELLQKSEGSVKKHLHRALVRLRSELADVWQVNDDR